MRPILEPDVLELLNDGRFDGDIEGYVVMDGPNYLGHMLYRIDGDFVDVLDCGLQESALVACAPVWPPGKTRAAASSP